jgi:hypothetical protein
MDSQKNVLDNVTKKGNWFTLNCSQQWDDESEWCGACQSGKSYECASERMVTNRPDFAWESATRDEDGLLIPRTIAAASHYYTHGLDKDTGGDAAPPFVEWSDCAIRRGDLEMVTADGPMPRYILTSDLAEWDEAREGDKYRALHGINSREGN